MSEKQDTQPEEQKAVKETAATPTKNETPQVVEQEESEHPEQPWVTDEDWVDDINVRWRKVIDELMKGSMIYDAYAKVYDIETSTPSGKNVAQAAGSRLLANVRFKKLWRKVIEERGFNEETADSVMLDLITNPKYDPKVRRAALHDYNELTGRIIKKTDLTSGGKTIEAPALMPAIEPRNASEAETETVDGS